jgi:glycosyltransferase involved in cell wall biosynthesis
MRELDRTRVEVHAACATGPAHRPTPTYARLREIPDVKIVRVSLGREVAGGSLGSKILALLSLVPAGWSVLRLARYVRRHGIDLLHTSDRPRDAAACVFLARITNAKCIVHAHVGFNPDWMRRTLQRAIRAADVLIAISDFVAGTLRDAGCDPSAIHVVLNGIEVDRWHPGLGRDVMRQDLGVDESTPVVLTACRLFRSKGVSELVQAVYDLREAVPTAELLVAGQEMEAGYLDELRAQVDEYGLTDRVRFLGHRDDVATLMAAADVFAMPSRYEPFGLVYAEAMAMALPVVALDDGGTPEVVEHGTTGLLSSPDDAGVLASNLGALLLDRERRAAFGANGRRRVERLFTTRRMAEDTATVYELVTARPQEGRTETSGNVGLDVGGSGSSQRNGHAGHPGH